MEELFKNAVGQAPGLVVLVFLVIAFLKRDRERDGFIKDLHSEHLAARGESRDAIRENTESNKEICHAVDKLTQVVNRFSDRINPN